MTTEIVTARDWADLSDFDKVAYQAHAEWVQEAHRYQIPPPLEMDYLCWLLIAGRGAGKTRSAAEALWWWAWLIKDCRALVLAPTSNDLKFTCFEGHSGLLSCIPEPLIVDYNKQDHHIKLVNGSSIRGISADSYERLRGPQFHVAWCCIGGTMIAMADGMQKPIENVRAGEVVLTRHGSRKVIAAGPSNNPSDLVSITVGSTRLTITIDHPILIEDRWTPAGDVKIGDRVWIESNMMASLGINGQAATTTINAAGICTDSFGRRLTARFRKALSSITGITMLRTTTSRIWRSCLLLSIWFTTVLDGLHLMGKRLRHRIVCDSIGILRATSSLSASSAAIHFSLDHQSLDRFARMYALRSGGQMPSFLKPESASGASPNTWRSRMFSGIAASLAGVRRSAKSRQEFQMAEVTAVERCPNQKTYNLTVEGEHEFIANGVIVHNCDELAAFAYIQEAWDMMQFGLRLGDSPKVIVTTTPRPKDLILDLVGREGDDVIIDRASTYENAANLAPTFQKQLEQYRGTKLFQQEVMGELVDLEEGKVVSRDMFKLWPAGKPFPKFEYILQSYDCAFSEKEHNDPTACTVWGVFKHIDGPMSVLLIDCWDDHLTFPDLKAKVLDEYRVSYGDEKRGKRPDLILVEDKAAGISLIQELRAAHLPVRGWNPGRADKMQRLQITASIFTSGRVWLPESSNRKGFVRDWAEGFLSQICSFPDATHDDYVDSATQAMRFLKDTGWLDIDPAPREDDDYDDYLQEIGHQTKVNPYAA